MKKKFLMSLALTGLTLVGYRISRRRRLKVQGPSLGEGIPRQIRESANLLDNVANMQFYQVQQALRGMVDQLYSQIPKLDEGINGIDQGLVKIAQAQVNIQTTKNDSSIPSVVRNSPEISRIASSLTKQKKAFNEAKQALQLMRSIIVGLKPSHGNYPKLKPVENLFNQTGDYIRNSLIVSRLHNTANFLAQFTGK